jgi:hypothetical protein
MAGNMLHQLLAVEPDLSTQGRNIMEEALTTFTKKAEHFDGISKVYSSFDEGDDKIPPEVKEVVTTVKEKLDYTKGAVIKAIDATLSKEETNASNTANAELEVNGVKFGTWSATSLLALEKYLVRIRDLYKNIPTFDPSRSWSRETTSGRDMYQSNLDVKYRTVKKQKVLTLAQATDKHPAQAQVIMDEVQVGKYDTLYFTGRVSPAEKSDLLTRVDDLVLAVKQAREKANQTQVKQVKLGEALFNYIHG